MHFLFDLFLCMGWFFAALFAYKYQYYKSIASDNIAIASELRELSEEMVNVSIKSRNELELLKQQLGKCV